MLEKRSKHTSWEERHELFYSQRMVPVDGYDWIAAATSTDEADATPEDVLTVKWTAKPQRRLIRQFDIETGIDIHNQMANLELTPGRIRGFANTFGWLGIGKQYRLSNTATVQGESFGLWKEHIASLVFAVQLHQALESANDAFLKKIMRWDAAKTSVEVTAGVKGKQVLGYDDEAVERWTYGEMKDRSDFPLDLHIRRTIAKKDSSQVVEFTRWERSGLLGTYQAPGAVLLAIVVNQHLSENAAPVMMIDGRGRRIGHTVPFNLVGLAWLQLYRVATGQLHIRVCVVCGNGIDVTNAKATRKMHDSCANRRRVQRHSEKSKGLKK